MTVSDKTKWGVSHCPACGLPYAGEDLDPDGEDVIFDDWCWQHVFHDLCAHYEEERALDTFVTLRERIDKLEAKYESHPSAD